MPQATPGQARVVDPILSAVARGYRSPKAAVANVLFPIVTVGLRAGRIISFGPDDFKLVNTARAPGANTKRIQFGYAGENYSLVDYRLEGAVPNELQEEASNGPGIDLSSNAVRRVQNTMALEREKQAADLARNEARYGAGNKETLSGTSQWSDPASDPFTDIMDGKESIRAKIGERPNVLTLGPKVLTALRPLCKGKLVVAFGAGGDRDKTKRPIMGEIAARLADEVVGAFRIDLHQHAVAARRIGDDIVDVALDAFGRDAMFEVVGALLLAPPVGFAHRAFHAAGDAVGVEDHAAIDIARGAADGLDQRGFPPCRHPKCTRARIRGCRAPRAAG